MRVQSHESQDQKDSKAQGHEGHNEPLGLAKNLPSWSAQGSAQLVCPKGLPSWSGQGSAQPPACQEAQLTQSPGRKFRPPKKAKEIKREIKKEIKRRTDRRTETDVFAGLRSFAWPAERKNCLTSRWIANKIHRPSNGS